MHDDYDFSLPIIFWWKVFFLFEKLLFLVYECVFYVMENSFSFTFLLCVFREKIQINKTFFHRKFRNDNRYYNAIHISILLSRKYYSRNKQTLIKKCVFSMEMAHNFETVMSSLIFSLGTRDRETASAPEWPGSRPLRERFI